MSQQTALSSIIGVAKISGAELTRRIKVSETSFYAWMSGKRNLGKTSQSKIIAAFGGRFTYDAKGRVADWLLNPDSSSPSLHLVEIETSHADEVILTIQQERDMMNDFFVIEQTGDEVTKKKIARYQAMFDAQLGALTLRYHADVKELRNRIMQEYERERL